MTVDDMLQRRPGPGTATTGSRRSDDHVRGRDRRRRGARCRRRLPPRRPRRAPIVVERATPAGGPTGLSSGICRAYYERLPRSRGPGRDRDVQRFDEIVGGDPRHRRTGLYLLHPEDDMPRCESVVRLNRLGIETDLLEPAELAERLPGVRPVGGVAIGAFERHAGYADPHATTEALVRAAVERGAELRLHRGHRNRARRRWRRRVRGRRGRADRVRSDPARRGALDPAAGPRRGRRPTAYGRAAHGGDVLGPADPVPGFGDVPGGFYLRPRATTSSCWAPSWRRGSAPTTTGRRSPPTNWSVSRGAWSPGSPRSRWLWCTEGGRASTTLAPDWQP